MLPTHVGVNRCAELEAELGSNAPHARGGEPGEAPGSR